MNTTTLYRPVGETELLLIKANGFTKFPPRLVWQSIFYPVLNEQYAIRIAKEWNTADAFSGYAGYVLAFDVATEFLQQYPVQNVGAALHDELWIPAEELENFNQHIAGPIRLIHSFYGPQYNNNPNGKTT